MHLYCAFVCVLFLRNRGNEARSLALGKHYLRGKQQGSAEDEFSGTAAHMMFFWCISNKKMPLLAVLSKRAFLRSSIADSPLQWCFHIHLIPSRMDPWQHIEGWTHTCLVVLVVCSSGEDRGHCPTITTLQHGRPELAGETYRISQPHSVFLQQKHLQRCPRHWATLWEKTSPLPTPLAAAANLPSLWAVLAWERLLSLLLSQAFRFCWLQSNPEVMMVEEGTLAWMQNTSKAALSSGGLDEFLFKPTQGAGI